MKFIAWLKDSFKSVAWKLGAWKEEEEEPQILASLGGFSPPAKKKPEEVKEELPDELPEIVPEPIPAEYISRIRNEFLSEAMANDLITRAKQRKSRAEEEALLLIL